MFIKNLSYICFFLFIITVITQDVCRHPKAVKSFNETACTGKLWYIYAGNIPCEGCCITRTLVQLIPGTMQSTDTTTVNGTTTSVTFTVTKFTADATYYALGNPRFLKVLDTDVCESFAVVYSEIAGIDLRVFTLEPEQEPDFLSKLKGVQMCDIDLYEYKPAINCFV